MHFLDEFLSGNEDDEDDEAVYCTCYMLRVWCLVGRSVGPNERWTHFE